MTGIVFFIAIMALIVIVNDNSDFFPNIIPDFRAEHNSKWARQQLTYIKPRLSKVAGVSIKSFWDDGCYNTLEIGISYECDTTLQNTYTVMTQARATTIEKNIQQFLIKPQALDLGTIKPPSLGIKSAEFPPPPPGELIDDYSANVPSRQGIACGWSFETSPSDVTDGTPKPMQLRIYCGVSTKTKIYKELSG